MTCPKCNSDEWKLASLVHSEGLVHVNTATTGSGAAVGTGGIGVGVGTAKTEGIQQSALSRAAAPPQNPAEGIATLFGLGSAILGFLFGWLAKDSVVLGFIFAIGGGFVGGIIGAIYGAIATKDVYQASLNAWANVRMCLRCGYFYTETAIQPADVHPTQSEQ